MINFTKLELLLIVAITAVSSNGVYLLINWDAEYASIYQLSEEIIPDGTGVIEPFCVLPDDRNTMLEPIDFLHKHN